TIVETCNTQQYNNLLCGTGCDKDAPRLEVFVMRSSGFTTIEMVIVVVLIGIIAMIGFPTISKTLDKTNVRSARDAVGTLAGTARAAAIQRGCRSVLHFASNTVWVTTACPTSVDTISGVQDLYA